MRYVIKGFILISLFVCMAGCRTTGYTVRITTDTLEYNEVLRLEAMLANKEYNVRWREKIDNSADPEVMTLLKKEFSREKVIQGVDPKDVKVYFERRYNEERYWWVAINLSYVKDVSNNKIRNVRVDIYNQFIGGISPEIKTEIDNIGDLIYQDLAIKIGKEKVTIEHREWGPPVFY